MLTSTSPGASYQCPVIRPSPIQAASPPNASAKTFPATTPARHPATVGQPTRLRYATTTWAGVSPRLFSTPIR